MQSLCSDSSTARLKRRVNVENIGHEEEGSIKGGQPTKIMRNEPVVCVGYITLATFPESFIYYSMGELKKI